MSLNKLGDMIPEVLCQILQYSCLPDHSSPACITSPLTLSWVSSYWRDVTINYQALWSAIRVMPRSDTAINTLHDCPIALLVDLWLSRSGNLPLQIVFGHTAKARVELGQALFGVISAYSSRWEDIDFHGCTFRPGITLPLKNGTLPLLKTCRIQEISIYNWELKPLLRELICSAASLRTFFFKGAVSLWLQNLGPNITSLSITDIYTSTHPRVICQVLNSLANHLESLALNVSSWTPQWIAVPITDSKSTLLLPKLHSLSIHTDSSVSPFFDMSTFPALREFEFYHDYSPRNGPALVSLLRRSQCPLEVLSLRNSQIPVNIMRECIELVNNTLVELNLHRAKGISASELCEILSPNQKSAYARHLRRLTFTEPRTLDEESEERKCKTFLDVLLERTTTSTPGKMEQVVPTSGLNYLHACVPGSQMRQLRSLIDSFQDVVELKVGCSRRSICVCLQA